MRGGQPDRHSHFPREIRGSQGPTCLTDWPAMPFCPAPRLWLVSLQGKEWPPGREGPSSHSGWFMRWLCCLPGSTVPSHTEGVLSSISEGRGGGYGQEELDQRVYLKWARVVGNLSLLHYFNPGLLHHGTPARALCPEQPSAQKAGGEPEGKIGWPQSKWERECENRSPFTDVFHMQRLKKHAQPHPALQAPRHAACCSCEWLRAPCRGAAVLLQLARVVKSSFFIWRQQSNTKPPAGNRTCCNKSLNLSKPQFGVSTAKWVYILSVLEDYCDGWAKTCKALTRRPGPQGALHQWQLC